MKIPDIVNDLFQARSDHKPAVIRSGAIKHIKIGDLIFHSGIKIPIPHRKLIEIAELRQVDSVCSFLIGRYF